MITTVDGRFSVLSAEHGQKRMGLDCRDEPLFESLSNANEVIPALDGSLFLLRRSSVSQEEYLEPLPFTIEQISKKLSFIFIYGIK